MMDKLLDITNQLLDLGKRNRLLNYKDTGLKSLRLLNKNVEEIFRHITNAKEYTFFNTDAFLTQRRQELGLTLEEENTLDYTEDKVYDLCFTTLQPMEILCYKRGYTLDKTIKALMKEFHFSLVEKGINSLYLSFGFIHYVEEEVEYVAPLLLVPVQLEGENGTYTLMEYEDEVLLNPTLKYYFNSLYHVEFIEYTREALSTYFSKIREILPAGTFLEEGSSLGIYSFYKMNMYNDLMQNKDIVIKNANIRALLGDESVEFIGGSGAPIYPVVNFDSSQLEAIQFAADGKSFCLQGPPGSGKSQTITNIIASLLGSGKKILFVSEKIAALKVVYENLRRAGLSDFAIELHSNKTNKKEFIDSLYNAATLPKYDIDFKTLFIGAKYENIKSNLNSYEYELHSKIPGLDISLLDLYSAYLNLDIEPMDFDLNVERLNLFDLDQILSLFEDYVIYSKELGYDYRESSLYGLNSVSESYVLYHFEDDLENSISHTKQLMRIKMVLNENTSLHLEHIKDVYSSLNLAAKLLEVHHFHPNYFNKKIRLRLIDLIESYLETSKDLKSDLFKTYKQTIINENLEDLYAKLKKSKGESFKFLNKEYKESIGKIQSYRNTKASADVILTELEGLIRVKKSLFQAKELSDTITKLLGNQNGLNFKFVLLDLRSLDKYEDIEFSENSYQNIMKEFENIKFSVKAVQEDAERLLELSKLFNQKQFDIYRLPVEDVHAKLLKIYTESTKLRLYLEEKEKLERLQKYNNSFDFLNEYLTSKRDIKYLTLNFKKLFFHKHIRKVIEESPLLKSFQSFDENELIENFRELDEKILRINRDMIISNNSQRRPDHDVLIEGSEFKILDREHEKSRRQLAIRVLLDQIFALALDVKPVFLMSPLSVSTYLASKLDIFDCVVFDEASQIFASDALGSIYRAKQCIVIGDTKQMPPTSFFQVGVEDTTDKEYDMESILDKASSRFPTSSLKWHYRSRSEELITFSNQSFYNSNLITIPQAKKHESGFGIDFVYVEDGRYDTSTRTNPIEARRVCDMVFEHFKNSNKSLGVVAFSNVQAELIADLVDKRLKKHPEFEKYFDDSMDEPFFVKNLESVQGDERDRIIFSICYGFNQDNKFYQRFGPLNNVGGERRLNVAITRAKYNITVVSSIRYSDINTNNTESQGVLLLRSYLEFAENVITDKNFAEKDTGIIHSVRAYIESLGFEVLPKYGSSSFKVDLAVRKNGEFVLAIMIDGQDYSSSLTDKYRLEKLLLERLGWKYFKLFSTAWLKQKDAEMERLRLALLATEEEDEEKELEEKSYLRVDMSRDSFEANFDEYQELHTDIALDDYERHGMTYLLRQLITREAPIHEEFLIKRVAGILMEKPKITAAFKKEIEDAIPNEVIKIGNFYYIDPSIKVRLRTNYNRDISYIPKEELRDGVYTLAVKNNGISVDGCYRTIAGLLCYDKIIPSLRKVLDEIVEELQLEQKVIVRKNSLYVR